MLVSEGPKTGLPEMLMFSVGYGWLGLKYGAGIGLGIVVIDRVCDWGFLNRRLW